MLFLLREEPGAPRGRERMRWPPAVQESALHLDVDDEACYTKRKHADEDERFRLMHDVAHLSS